MPAVLCSGGREDGRSILRPSTRCLSGPGRRLSQLPGNRTLTISSITRRLREYPGGRRGGDGRSLDEAGRPAVPARSAASSTRRIVQGRIQCVLPRLLGLSRLPDGVDERLLKGLITRNGGEPVNREQLPQIPLGRSRPRTSSRCRSSPRQDAQGSGQGPGGHSVDVTVKDRAAPSSSESHSRRSRRWSSHSGQASPCRERISQVVAETAGSGASDKQDQGRGDRGPGGPLHQDE